MVLHLFLHLSETCGPVINSKTTGRPAQVVVQPVFVFTLFVHFNWTPTVFFQGPCALISVSTEKPQATEANVDMTKAKHLSQASIVQVSFSLKHCLRQIVCGSLIVRNSSVSSKQLVANSETCYCPRNIL